MKITILGSGAWQGIPAPFCDCSICRQAIQQPFTKNSRMRPEIMIETEKGAFLLEVSPDIRTQSTRFRLPQVKNFFISHWHFDHMYGLHELLTWAKKSQEKPVVHCSAGTKEKIDREFSYIPLIVNVLQPYKKFALHGVTITPVPVYHMFNIDDSTPENKLNNAFGYILEHKHKRVAYLGDYYRIPKKTLKAIQDVDILIADGTYLLTEEYKEIKQNHFHGQEILDFVASTRAHRIYFHSISHLTGYTHDQMQKFLPVRHYISYDGMKINLKLDA